MLVKATNHNSSIAVVVVAVAVCVVIVSCVDIVCCVVCCVAAAALKAASNSYEKSVPTDEAAPCLVPSLSLSAAAAAVRDSHDKSSKRERHILA